MRSGLVCAGKRDARRSWTRPDSRASSKPPIAVCGKGGANCIHKHNLTSAQKFQALTVEQALRLALEHHRGGRFAQTELLYRKTLQSVPGHPDALHMVEMPAHQAGKSEIARDLVRLALARKPEDHIMHFDLGMIIARLGRHEDAILCCRKAIALK